MAFMKVFLDKYEGFEYEDEYGNIFYTDEKQEGARPYSGYIGYLSAPGYLDRTDDIICKTKDEVALALLEMYFDDSLDSYDDEQKREIAELEKICDGS